MGTSFKKIYQRSPIIRTLNFLYALCIVYSCSSKSNEQVNLKNEDGRTPLHIAAIKGEAEKVDSLLSTGGSIDLFDNYKFTALHYASLHGHAGVVEFLIQHHANPDALDHYNHTPLHHAVERGHAKIVQLLLNAGTNLQLINKNNQTALQLAAAENRHNIAELVDPFFQAILGGNVTELDSLISNDKTSMDRKDHHGRTLLHKAYILEKDEIVDYLKSNGADPKLADNFGNRPEYYSQTSKAKRSGVNRVDELLEYHLDAGVYEFLPDYQHINIGIIMNGEIVSTKSYGKNVLNDAFAWGSVSKPATAIIVMQLVESGLIQSINDNVWQYSKRYENCMPEKFKNDSLTIKHLLIHQSGIPHNNVPIWKNGKLNLQFKPGTDDLYSTPGYGILGHVIEAVTGLSYDQAVKKYLGLPVGAQSFFAGKHFRAPGARIHSSILDFARFASGVINQVYLKQAIINNTIFRIQSGLMGLGWQLENANTADLKAYHGGSNGRPQAYLGQELPGLEAKVFAPGIVSSKGNFEHALTISPDGKEIYFTQKGNIMVCRREQNGWTAPEIASFSREFPGSEPHITTNGKSMFYNRCGDDGAEIWMMEKAKEEWSTPVYHSQGMFATTANTGNLYVTGFSDKNDGGNIVYSRLVNGSYAKPEKLKGGVNTPYFDAHPCIAPDESFIVFDSTRPGGKGWSDFYVSFRMDDN